MGAKRQRLGTKYTVFREANTNGNTILLIKLWLLYYDRTRYLHQPFHRNYFHRTNYTRSDILPSGKNLFSQCQPIVYTSQGTLVWSWNFRKLKAFTAIISNWPFYVILVSYKFYFFFFFERNASKLQFLKTLLNHHQSYSFVDFPEIVLSQPNCLTSPKEFNSQENMLNTITCYDTSFVNATTSKLDLQLMLRVN